MDTIQHLKKIGAIVLAAGKSTRMGQNKLMLPWHDTTIIGQVCNVLISSGIDPVVVVTGEFRRELEQTLSGQPVIPVYNEEYERGEMISSVKKGILSLPASLDGALIVLGDQPQIEGEVVTKLAECYFRTAAAIVFPSYQMKRGHPWFVRRDFWPEILDLKENQTLRDFLALHQSEIYYLPVNRNSVLADIDTPEDYKSQTSTLI